MSSAIRLGLNLGYSGRTIELPVGRVLEAERLGYHVVWAAESYGSDAVTPLAWLGALTSTIRLGTAILQMSARTPAMTAMTLDQLSGGRMVLGLGVSGPQVVEGWHGVAYGKPLGRTREYVSIVRKIFAREQRLEFAGRHYQIPYRGEDATGLGKPLKSILHGRADIPIYLAAIGPKNVALAAEIADGWLPFFLSPRHFDETYRAIIETGFAKAGAGKGWDDFDISATVPVVVGENTEVCRNQVKPFVALYIGGMGARSQNFYYNLACRYGYEEAASKIQDYFLAGERGAAMAAVPDALVDDIALCGPKQRIAERLELWKSIPVRTLNVSSFDAESLRVMAELLL